MQSYGTFVSERIQIIKVEIVLDGSEARLPKLAKKVLLLLFHLLLNLPNLLEFLDPLVVLFWLNLDRWASTHNKHSF